MPNGHYNPDVHKYIVEHWLGGYILKAPPWRIGIRHPRFNDENFQSHVDRFSDGQFIGDRRAANFGICTTLRTSQIRHGGILPWLDIISDKSLAGHEPEGSWLYIVLMWVHPNYRRRGMGSAFIRACSALAVRKNLRGIYVVGLLKGYEKHLDEMDVSSYWHKVRLGKIYDPVVSLFLKRGFRDVSFYPVVPDCFDEPNSGGAGVLLFWKNYLFDSGKVI